MRDRFFAKTWIHWAKLLVFLPLGAFAIVAGVLFWTGTLTDAHGVVRPSGGPPLVIFGCLFIFVAAMALARILASIRPIIRCYRSGIECNLAGVTSVDGIPLVPGVIRVAWAIFSTQGFRAQRLRIQWDHFHGAEVRGLPMALVLAVHGTATNVSAEFAASVITFKQAALREHPQEVAESLNHLAGNSTRRDQLPDW